MNKHMIFDNPPISYDVVDGVDLELRDLFFCHPMIKKHTWCIEDKIYKITIELKEGDKSKCDLARELFLYLISIIGYRSGGRYSIAEKESGLFCEFVTYGEECEDYRGFYFQVTFK